ncbi:hypothetical protein DHEL01_v208546 [Diaporthe helianthi]|uniref:Uncharacterized protein n=1 Tax=Diaporthe helianthi TaxID=158607 RepID=A0A2P5HS10_DIAHE|nr:hypothetical protein DHEL01_v208546 [Diaporthe helianthi]
MSTNPPTRPQFKFFLYSDPADAKKPDNKRQVRIHVARNSHAKTRKARIQKTTRTCQARGDKEPKDHQNHGGRSSRQVADWAWSNLTPLCSGPRSSPYPPGVMVFDSTLPTPCNPTILAWVPPTGSARRFVQVLSQEEQVLLDHYVTVQVSQWRSKYEAAHQALDLPGFRHGMATQLAMFCLTDPGLIQAILLVSSQVFANLHYSAGNVAQGRNFEQRSFQHRGRLLREMAENMPKETRHVTDAIITKGLFLTFNEWSKEEIYAARDDTFFTTA